MERGRRSGSVLPCFVLNGEGEEEWQCSTMFCVEWRGGGGVAVFYHVLYIKLDSCEIFHSPFCFSLSLSLSLSLSFYMLFSDF